jgi:hypothetical protein
MSDYPAHLALFDDIDPASSAIVKLREIGIYEKDMDVISGLPYSHKILGRPEKRTYVPLVGVFGALIGLGAGATLNFGVPLLYPMSVGGKPLLPIPPGLLIMFETTMLGLLVFSFIGVMIENGFPFFRKKPYHADVANGKIALVFHCPPKLETAAYEAMKQAGAEKVSLAETITL